MHPLVQNKHDLVSVGDAIGNVVLNDLPPARVVVRLPRRVRAAPDSGRSRCVGSFTWGVGVWGINVPVAWGFAIVNFVWWIGIGHAGTLISAILLLLHQKWRTSINRFSEAMTIFAVMCAGLFPLLHMGRPWFFYWLYPFPNVAGVYPQFRSPLVWDVFAVTTYFTVSLGVLVHRAWCPTSRPFATSRRRSWQQHRLRHPGHRLARLGDPLAPL